MWTRAILNAFAAIALLLSLAAQAAPLVNGGFETGDLTGWDCGGGGYQPATGGAAALSGLSVPSVGPTEGNYIVMLSNGGGNSAGPPLNHGLPPGPTVCGGGTLNPIPPVNPSLDPCLGVNTSCLAYEFDEIWQTFSVAGARALTFDWNYLTNDPVVDWAFVSINGNPIQLLGYGAATGAFIDEVSQNNGQYGFETGWFPFAYVLPAAGDYTLTFGIVNGVDTTISSALLVDNIQVLPPRLIPEPATLTLLCVAFAGAGLARRGKHRAGIPVFPSR